MKKSFVALIFAVGIIFNADARTTFYNTGIGIRAGKFNSGISYKHFGNSDNMTAIQIDAYFTHVADGGYTLKGFYLWQIPFKMPIVQLPLDFIYGSGLHAGYFPLQDRGYYKRSNGKADYYGKSVFTGGIDATVQVEYQVSKKFAPLTITLDCVPFYEFYNRGPEYIDFGVSLRCILR